MRLLTACLLLCATLLCSPMLRAADDDDEPEAATPTLAAELERQVAALPPTADAPQALCVFLHKRGLAYLQLGKYDNAIADLKQALALRQSATAELWCDHWRMQGNLRGALYSAGDWLLLADFAQTVSDEYRESNAWRYFGTQLWLIDAQINLANLRQAEESFRRASDILPSLRQQNRIWQIYGANALSRHSAYAARMQMLRGNYVEAERYQRQALRYAREYMDSTQARRSPEHQDTRAARHFLSEHKRGLAGILSAQGKTGEAEILARQVLQETLSRSTGNTRVAAGALSMLGKIKLQQAQIGEALNFQQQALTALEASDARPYSTALSDLRAQIGFLLGVQGRWADALKIFAQRDQGLRGNAEQFARTGSSNMTWALALLRNRQPDEAEKMLRNIISWNRKKPFIDPLYFAQLRGYLALTLVATGKNLAALNEFREAFPVLLQQAETDNSSENGGFVRQYRLRLIADGYLELLARLNLEAALPAGQDAAAEAFQIAEAARASSVQQAIASSAARARLPDAALAELARREQDSANQISALNKLLLRLASEAESQRLDKTIAAIRADVVRMEGEHAGLRRELAARYPAYADLVAPKAPLPADVQKVLRGGEAALAIYVAEHKTYVWTITPTRTAFRALDLPRAQIDAQVTRLRQSFDLGDERIPPFDVADARALYAELLAPDAALWSDANVLNVIPHGSLGQLPFAVLLTGETGDRGESPWLIRKLAIAQQPSAGTLIALRGQERQSAQRNPFVGFGDPLFVAQPAAGRSAATRSVRNLSLARAGDDGVESSAGGGARRGASSTEDAGIASLAQGFALLPPLPDTADELNEIGKSLGADLKADIFLGRRATESKVKSSDLAHYRVVAFATHGLVPGDLRGLDQPSLAMANPALADDAQNDGFLTMSEVLELKLDADWVVLSACNTAGGDGKSEEAVSGLGRAFFFAGTRRLLVSFWPVETVSARLLTTELFRRQVEQPEEAKAAALRHSMLKLMGETKDYAHPAFWAPFALIGEPAR